MDQQQLTPMHQVGDTVFYKYPYLEIGISLLPATAIFEIWNIWTIIIKGREDAANVLATLVDRGLKVGIQTQLYIENTEVALPEAHRLTRSVLTLTRHGEILSTPPAPNYAVEKLYKLFGIA